MLTADFRFQSRTYPSLHSGVRLWDRFDRDFHDFDILAKKVLLALRLFLTCLPEGAIGDFAAGVRSLLKPGVKPIAA